MSDSPRHQIRVPHWGWFLLPTVGLVVGYVGLAIWQPWHHEQEAIRHIESWGGRVATETDAPEWLRELVGADRIKELEVFERVVKVSLCNKRITDSEVVHLRTLSNLKVILLHDTAVTDAGLAHLIELPFLYHVNLEDTKVTDAGLAHLSGCTKLKNLFLSRTAVTDAGLVHLNGLRNLELLYLDDTVVTATGIEELQKALPDCAIPYCPIAD
jgi:hypothetical protein